MRHLTLNADTIDLQDSEAPSASEHTKHPINGAGIAPHQAAQYQHVAEERHSEEAALASEWADNLTEEPGAMDVDHPETEGAKEGEGGKEGEETEAEGDDDMMDRISSSPSIDDGESWHWPSSSPPTSQDTVEEGAAWPERGSSRSVTPTLVHTPQRATFNQSPIISPSSTSTAQSSPFVRTPEHLPLRLLPQETCGSPIGTREVDSVEPVKHRPPTPPSRPSLGALGKLRMSPTLPQPQCAEFVDSPTIYTPDTSPLLERAEARTILLCSAERQTRHRMVKYNRSEDRWSLDRDVLSARDTANEDTASLDSNATVIHSPLRDEGNSQPEDQAPFNIGIEADERLDLRPIESPFRTHDWARHALEPDHNALEQSPSLMSIRSVNMNELLLPAEDPLLDATFEDQDDD